jgi:hypothetical protein
LDRYTGDARERLDSVGYYHAPALSVGDLIAFADVAACVGDPHSANSRAQEPA